MLRGLMVVVSSFWSDMQARGFRAAEMPHPNGALVSDMAILRALDARAFEPAFQPIVSVDDRRVAGFEALARLRIDPTTRLGPERFLPVAEREGRLGDVASVMIRAATRALAGWMAAGASPLFVSINVAQVDVESAELAPLVAGAIAEAGLPAGALKIELTENHMLRDMDAASARLRDLRKAGAHVLLDDFGMGYSGLAWLSRLPLDGIKIDRFFIQAMANDQRAAAILRAILGLAREMGLNATAEGVETPAQMARLRDLGCDFAQGYLFSRPLLWADA